MAAALLPKETTLLVSSLTSKGAIGLSSDGSSFVVQLEQPLQLSSAAISCEVALSSARIWFVSPNVSPELGNDHFRFTTSDPGGPGSYDLTILPGLYSLAGLGEWLGLQLADLGLSPTLFKLDGDQASGSTILTIERVGDSADVGYAGSVFSLLGWAPGSLPVVAATPNEWRYSDERATLNRLTEYNIVASFISGGILTNGRSRGVIGTVPITVPPGSQVTYAPAAREYFNAPELLGGTTISSFRISLTDQDLRPVDCFGEEWSASISIRSYLLLSEGGSSLPMAIR